MSSDVSRETTVTAALPGSADLRAAAAAAIAQGMDIPIVRDLFGIDLLEWEPGKVSLALACRPELGFMPGSFQGAATTAIAEYAAGLSGVSLQPDLDSMTLQQTIHFTGAARGERLVAHGRVIASGRRISTTAAEVFVERDGVLHHCAALTMTMAHRDKR